MFKLSAFAAALACALAFFAQPARAEDIYFHRAGADWSQYTADVTYCVNRIHDTYANVSNVQTPYPYQGTVAGGLGTAIAVGIIAAVEDPGVHKHNAAYCMVTRGWEVVTLDHGLGPRPAQAGQGPEASAPQPQTPRCHHSDRQASCRTQANSETGPISGTEALTDDRIKSWFSEPAPPEGHVTLAAKDIARPDDQPPPPITLETAMADDAARHHH